jgi:hypothetical protein
MEAIVTSNDVQRPSNCANILNVDVGKAWRCLTLSRAGTFIVLIGMPLRSLELHTPQHVIHSFQTGRPDTVVISNKEDLHLVIATGSKSQ